MRINIITAVVAVAVAAAASASASENPAGGTGAREPGEASPTERAEAPAEGAPARTAAEPAKGDAATKDDVKALTEELRRLKLEIGLREVEYRSFAGMGPAASKVYFAPKGLSIGGYGELTYQNAEGPANDVSDLLRAVIYAGYRFNERILFNSEIEFEHAGREISVEFAYLDFLFRDALRLRVGNILVPLGFVNEMHEPAFFNGVFRPDVERRLIPTTWSENGLGLHGEVNGLRYKAYFLTGLDLFRDTGDEPVETSTWIRETRSGGAESRAATFAGVVSLGYDFGPVALGGAFYGGRADQRRVPGFHSDVTLTELHAGLAFRGLTARVLGVVGTLGNAARVSEELGLPPGETLGSRVQGGYVEVGYDVLALLAPGGEASVTPFVRYEQYDLNARVPDGFERDPALDVDVITAGLTFKPIPTVVVKADYQRREDRSNASAEQVNLGVGYVF